MSLNCDESVIKIGFMIVLNLVHISIWMFVLLAFVNKKTAMINILYVIPVIYVLHILPFHIITKGKEYLCPHTHEEKFEVIKKVLLFPHWFEQIQHLFKHSSQNPLSVQGMLIFGALTSAYRLLHKA